MSFENILQIATLATLFVGIIGVLVRINGYKRQINANLFVEYAARYDDIMKSFPRSAWSRRFAGGDQMPEETDEITICVFRFLHFLAGAHYFHKKGYLEHEAWQVWEGEVRRTLKSPLFRREWRKFAGENSLVDDFRQYVEGIQNQAEKDEVLKLYE